MKVSAVILAAGKGTRFKSDRAKVIHPLLGRPMVAYPLALVKELEVERTVVVVGHQEDRVRAACGGYDGIRFATQVEQRGTGDAVAAAKDELVGFDGSVLILSGDVPLLSALTLQQFMMAHERSESDVSFMWASLPDPTGYGRVVRGATGFRIVEHKDASLDELAIREINVGLYLVQADYLFSALEKITPDNAQHEYYLPDVINLAPTLGAKCTTFEAADPEEVLGVNDRAQLAQAETRLRAALVEELMRSGISCQDPGTTYVDAGVEIGPDTTLGAGVHLLGRTKIGRGVIIEPNCYLKDAVVENGAVIEFGTRLVGGAAD